MTHSGPAEHQADVLRRALLELRRTRSRLAELASRASEPIAVIGMSCRFPGGANDIEGFWELLREGRDGISEVPPDRWDIDRFYDPDPDAPGKMSTRWGGFLSGCDVAAFDADFFGISRREAVGIDPQQRLLLEVAWEALERSGRPPDSLAGSRAGVFVGISTADYSQLGLRRGLRIIDAYSGTGNTASVAAGRLSYLLGLRGPCLPVDTACSSSLVTVHIACQSLRLGESDLAIAAGVNLVLAPENTVFFSKLRAMAPDGRCKTFDAAADGYVRGEGCGVVVLKRLADAVADGDPVAAVIRGSAVNHDGRSNGLTAPSGPAQEAVIAEALRAGGVDPGDVGYVEAHGTGTPLGDPVEIEALAAVLGPRPDAAPPLLIGSVKTNIGHLEAAAGVAGLIKCVLALERGVVPAHLHLEQPNPMIRWGAVRAEVPTAATAWPDGRPRIAAVSSFGFSGTNAHVVLERPSTPAPPADGEDGLDLLTLSARTPQALRELAAGYGASLEVPGAALGDISATAAMRRSRFEHSAALVAASPAEAAGQLAALARGEPAAGATVGRAVRGEPLRVVFAFPGQGSQHAAMGRGLLGSEPAFAAALEACDAAVRAHGGPRVLDELRGDARLDDIAVVQPLLFSIEVALTALWRSWGIEPDAVIGHSMGEIAAAHVAGALSLDDAARVVCRRSAALRRVSGQGAMALVELPLDEAAELVARHADEVSVAVSSGPRSTVLSGDPARLRSILDELARRDVFCRPVKVDVASHSPQMDALAGELGAALAGLEPRAATIPFHSTVTAAPADGSELTAGYWQRNLREPVLLWPTVERLAAAGRTAFVELGPHPILLPSLEDGLGGRGAAIASLRRDEDERRTMLGALGALHALGRRVDFARLGYERRPYAPLPTYPWQRERFWHPAPVAAGPDDGDGHPVLARSIRPAARPGSHVFEGRLDPATLPFLADHRIRGAIVVPAAVQLELAAAAGAEALGTACTLADVELEQALVLGEEAGADVQLSFEPGDDGELAFALHARAGEQWLLQARGRARPRASEPPPAAPAGAGAGEPIDGDRFYDRTWRRGVELGAGFRGIRRLWRADGDAVAEIAAPPGGGRFLLHPALLDQCLQVVAAACADPGDDALHMPVRVDAAVLHGAGAARACEARRTLEHDGGFAGDARLLDADGGVLAELEGVTFRRVDDPAALVPDRIEDWLYGVRWAPADAPAPRERDGVVVAGDGGEARALAELLERHGGHCKLLGRDAPPAAVLAAAAAGATVVQLAALDAGTPEAACRPVLALAHALARHEGEPPELVLVTRGALQLAGEPVAVHQAPVWGLGRTIARELPRLRCTLVDLDPDPDADAGADLLAALGAGDGEPQVALRGGVRHVARLARRPLELGEPFARVDPAGTYLITGGLGVLGLAVAERLAAAGAGRLVLVGRSAPDGDALRRVGALRAAGTPVDVAQADVADAAALRAVLERLTGPLRGVFHAAGVLADAALAELDWEGLAAALAPKAGGAWNLHELTRAAPLDCFVLFSSVAAILGGPGQAAYAAANAFLDALAEHRRAAGLPALSVNWGPWGEAGLGAAGAERLARAGLGTIAPERGLEALGGLLGTDAPRIAVMPLDVRQACAADERLASLPLMADLAPAAPPAPATGVRDALLAAEPWERRTLLETALCGQIGAVLRRDPARIGAETPLAELGFDSLMALELRNRLESQLAITLSTTLVWRHPTVGAVVDHIAERLGLELDGPPPDDELDRLSEDDVAELVAQELAGLQDRKLS